MKIAFVIPWYGKDISGGAESECKKTALNLQKRGVEVEILTTCVKDFHSDWSTNVYEEKEYEIEGLIVRRFRVKKRDTRAFDAVNLKLMSTNVSLLSTREGLRSPVFPEEEKIYIEEMINSPALYEYIDKNRANYDFFVFIPYMFGTTYYGSGICREKAIIIPCLHNEPYAYMNIYKEMFNRANCLIFHARSEQRLAKRLYGVDDNRGYLIGEGIDSDVAFNGERFRRKYRIDTPFILYAGRKDSTKNTPLLIDYFLRYLEKNDYKMKLVLIGPGNINITHDTGDDIIDLGFIPQQDKYDACDAAFLLCQPSLNESFSIVIMESWLAETPVIVYSDCDVTRDHCVSSNGGLFFADYSEFEECINYIISNPLVAKKMGKAGKNYVLKNYAWRQITNRYLSIFSAIKQKAQQASINIMTACLSGGDAIGNYIQSQRKIFTELGYCVNIFADGGDTDFILSSKYESTGKDILWFHYSIYSDNLKHIKRSRDFKIMDFHGVSPPKQFRGYNKTLEELTRKGIKYLNRYVKDFNLCVVHSDYTFNELKRVGYKNIIKSPLVINKEIFEASQDPIFSRLLSQLDYLLFVGRIVPQKDIISIIRLFSELKRIRQKIVLFLVGDTDISMKYTKEVYALIESLGLEKNILLTGKIVDSHILTTFFKYAKFLIILSEWETFCVPIIEAMHFRVPVIGIEKTCIPETIGDAGILLKDLDFKRNAEIINSFWSDEEKYESLQQNCIKRSKLFEEEELKIRMKEIVENISTEDMY